MRSIKGTLQFLGILMDTLLNLSLLIFVQIGFQGISEDESLKILIALEVGILFPHVTYLLNRIINGH